MPIVKAENMMFTDKTFTMIIYGPPGIGKTSLALSAPHPILIDFDRGIARVKPYHRKDTIVCDDYYQVLEDINSPEVKAAETVIIDTGGSFVTYLQAWAMKENPSTNRQHDNKTISLKGHGAVKAEFLRFSNFIRDILHKNLIYIFHSDEQKDKDGNPMQRLLCEGAARTIVWQPCDFGGFMEMNGDKRTITFSPSERFFAKGCFGITGQYTVPTLEGPEMANDFLTKLFDKARANIAKENEYYAPLRDQYERTMADAESLIKEIDSPDAANAAAKTIPNMKHALTSLSEIRAMFAARVKELGYVFDKKTKEYSEPNPPENTETEEASE